MREPKKRRAKWQIFGTVICVSLLVVSFAVITLNRYSTPESVNQVLVIEQSDGNENSSMVENLTAQIATLKREILNLETALSAKQNENEELKGEVRELRDSLDQIVSELKAIQQNEQIMMLVERLRTEPPP